MRIHRVALGVHIGHDCAAALLIDGDLVYAEEEERHVGRKSVFGRPAEAIKAALAYTGLRRDSVAAIGFTWSGTGLEKLVLDRRRTSPPAADWFALRVFGGKQKLAGMQAIRAEFPHAQALECPHHEAHRLSLAPFTSITGDRIAIVADAVGEFWSTTAYGIVNGRTSVLRRWPVGNSLGYFYQRWAELFGFFGKEAPGYLMSLAAYGDPASRTASRVRDEFLVNAAEGGQRINQRNFHPCWGAREPSRAFRPEFLRALDLPREIPRIDLQAYADVAAGVQSTAEAVLLSLVDRAHGATGLRNLELSGGVFHNCMVVGAIRRSPLLDEVVVGPASKDSGTAIGAAVLASRRVFSVDAAGGVEKAFWGTPVGNAESLLRSLVPRGCLQVEPFDRMAELAVEDLLADRIIAVAEGRLEFGPRALGGRSILASATNERNVTTLNAIKKRYPFQPIAASATPRAARRLFGVVASEPFMTAAYTATDAARGVCPAALHVDGTCRIQVIQRDIPAFLSAILVRLEQRGLPGIVLNTSFNGPGRPLPRTLSDCVREYCALAVHVLYCSEARLELNAQEKSRLASRLPAFPSLARNPPKQGLSEPTSSDG